MSGAGISARALVWTLAAIVVFNLLGGCGHSPVAPGPLKVHPPLRPIPARPVGPA